MQTKKIEYQHSDTVHEGVLVTSGDEPKPTVLVAHDWTGRRQPAIDWAEKFAGLGYNAFALDMYGKGVFGSPDDNAKNESLMMPLLNDRAILRGRVQAALSALDDEAAVDSSRVAAVGFCFGGLTVLDLARSGANVRGVVSIHGLLNAPEGLPEEKITAKVLVLHGHEDPMVPPDHVATFAKAMTAAEVDWQVHVYGNTMHAFTNEGANLPKLGMMYNEASAKRAIRSCSDFLADVLA